MIQMTMWPAIGLLVCVALVVWATLTQEADHA